jgi:hypothetical protein
MYVALDAAGGGRTHDSPVKSRVLCQLSYRHEWTEHCSHRESNPGCLVENQESLPLDDDCGLGDRIAARMQPAGFEPASSG